MTEARRKSEFRRETETRGETGASRPRSAPRKRRGDRRDEIVRAATDVFAERGYRGGSLAAVAERVGLTQQGVLHYFASKEALLVEVLRRRDEIDTATLFPAGGAHLAHIVRLVAFNVTQPGLVQSFTVLSAESVTESHPAKEFFTERYRTLRSDMTRKFAAELGDPGPSGLTAEQSATLLIAVMDGLQQQWLLDPEAVDMPSLVSALADVLRGAPAAARSQ